MAKKEIDCQLNPSHALMNLLSIIRKNSPEARCFFLTWDAEPHSSRSCLRDDWHVAARPHEATDKPLVHRLGKAGDQSRLGEETQERKGSSMQLNAAITQE